MLRTPLGPRSGNARRGPELAPYQRGLIVGAASSGRKPTGIAGQYKLPLETIKSTLRLDLERNEGESKPRNGRPKAYSDRGKWKIVR
jgi:hypothetical protein